ncbi:hypothetical protein ABKN59_003164 [Abortiporus biennis]
MSKPTKAQAVEEPKPEEFDDAEEESDEYDIEEEEEGEVGGYEQDDADEEDEDGEADEDEEGLTAEGSNLTALLLGGATGDAEEGEEEEDDEYQETTAEDSNGAPTHAAPLGTKRPREEESAYDVPSGKDVSGDYGEFEENSKSVNKKARQAATAEEEEEDE